MPMRSILVYTGGEIIGDGLIKLPYMMALRQAYPHATIHWWSDGPSVYQTVLKEVANTYVDRLYVPPSLPARFRRYGIIIDTQKKFLNTLRLKLIPHGQFISASAKFMFSTHKSPAPLARHDVLRLLEMTSLAGTPLAFARQPLMLAPTFRALAQELLPSHPGGKCYIGLVVGAGQARKKWPLDNFIAVAKWLKSQSYTPMFILGPQETDDYQILKTQLPDALYPLQCPRAPFSPLFTIAVAEQLKLGISNDCGGGHMLASAGIPLVSLFGPTNPDKVAPLVEQGHIIKAQDYGNSEMSSIPVNAVIDAVYRLMPR